MKYVYSSILGEHIAHYLLKGFTMRRLTFVLLFSFLFAISGTLLAQTPPPTPTQPMGTMMESMQGRGGRGGQMGPMRGRGGQMGPMYRNESPRPILPMQIIRRGRGGNMSARLPGYYGWYSWQGPMTPMPSHQPNRGQRDCSCKCVKK